MSPRESLLLYDLFIFGVYFSAIPAFLIAHYVYHLESLPEWLRGVIAPPFIMAPAFLAHYVEPYVYQLLVPVG